MRVDESRDQRVISAAAIAQHASQPAAPMARSAGYGPYRPGPRSSA